jgi:hypothetical protein
VRGVSKTLDSRHLTRHAMDLYIDGRLRSGWDVIYNDLRNASEQRPVKSESTPAGQCMGHDPDGFRSAA